MTTKHFAIISSLLLLIATGVQAQSGSDTSKTKSSQKNTRLEHQKRSPLMPKHFYHLIKQLYDG